MRYESLAEAMKHYPGGDFQIVLDRGYYIWEPKPDASLLAISEELYSHRLKLKELSDQYKSLLELTEAMLGVVKEVFPKAEGLNALRTHTYGTEKSSSGSEKEKRTAPR